MTALHWNEETYQRFGKIVFSLMSGNNKTAEQGYVDYFAMKRLFNKKEFEDVINRLNVFRENKNLVTIPEMVEHVKNQLVKNKTVVEIERHPPDIPERVQEIFKKIDSGFYNRKKKKEIVEQMSLF